MPHADKIHEISILFSETSMATRRCLRERESPAYHWEEEEEEEEKEEEED